MSKGRKKRGAAAGHRKPQSGSTDDAARSAGAGSAGDPKSSADSQPDDDTPFHQLRLWQIQPIRDLLFVAALLAILWLGWAMSIVTVPLLVGLMLAYLFEPIVRILIRHLEWSRLHAVSVLMLSTGVMLIVVLSFVVPLVISQSVTLLRSINDGTVRRQAERIAAQIPEPFRDDFEGLIELFPIGERSLLPDRFEFDDDTDDADGPDRAEGEVDDAPDGEGAPADPSSEVEVATPGALTEDDVRRIITEMRVAENRTAARGQGMLTIAGGGFTMLGRIVAASIYIMLLAFLIPFCFFFFSLWYPSILEFGKRLLPRKHKSSALDLIVKMDRVVNGFVRGRIVVSSITAVLLSFGWFLLDVQYGIILGIVTGVLFLVPFLPTLGWFVMLAVALFTAIGTGQTHEMWWMKALVWPSVWYGVVQVVETYFLTPKIAGKATNLDPVTVVIVVVAGGALGGVYGMLLAIPIAACGKILITEVFFPKIDAWLKGERTDPLPFDRGD